MTAPDPLGPAAMITVLSSTTHPLGDLTALPAESGLYAWWAAPEILPHLPGPAHPHQRTDRVVLIAQDEARLTDWMHTHLHLTWCEHPDPAAVEPTVITRWAPPLNLNHATGAIRDVVTATRTAFNSSA